MIVPKIRFCGGWFLTTVALCLTGCTSPAIDSVHAFREARKRGDYETARSYLTEDPRVWYETQEGDGSPWNLSQGRWKHWDTYFNGHSEPLGGWQEEGQRVWVDMHETNDYFRLLDRPGGHFRLTYFFTDPGKIKGYMISAVPGPLPWTEEERMGRFEEFKTWALHEEPEEVAYLMPNDSIDPTGDRPPRMRALLERWREVTGLPAIE